MEGRIQPGQGGDGMPSPVRMLAILMSAVFVIELSVMAALQTLPPISAWAESILDAAVLAALLFPTLYFLIFRPLTRLVIQHRDMEEELLKHRNHLEELVTQRTEQVNNYLRRHEEEDALAAYVMGRYLNSPDKDSRVGYLILSASHHFSGDAISIIRTPDGSLNVMMLDAMGHGLAAAINALPAIQAFNSMSRKGMTLQAMIPEINDKVRELTPAGRFLAGTFLHLDASNSMLTGWIGGTPNVIVKNAGELASFSSKNLSLGILPSARLDFEYFTCPWHSESLLVTCTDGVLESHGRDGKELGASWLQGIIRKHGNSLDKTAFDQAWKESLGSNKPHDDASILIINQAASAATANCTEGYCPPSASARNAMPSLHEALSAAAL